MLYALFYTYACERNFARRFSSPAELWIEATVVFLGAAQSCSSSWVRGYNLSVSLRVAAVRPRLRCPPARQEDKSRIHDAPAARKWRESISSQSSGNSPEPRLWRASEIAAFHEKNIDVPWSRLTRKSVDSWTLRVARRKLRQIAQWGCNPDRWCSLFYAGRDGSNLRS